MKRNIGFAFAIALLLPAVIPDSCWAQKKYTPEHPRVEESVNKAIRFIESRASDSKGGDLVLAALAIVETSKRYNALVPVDHPLVQKAGEYIAEEIDAGRLQKHDSLYFPCLSLILLCDIGDEKYREQITTLLKAVVDRQEVSGAYTYKKFYGKSRGDTSQTQYVALALWVAHKHGFQIPDSVPQRMLDWMMNVQQSNGAWYYDYVGEQKANPLLKFTLSIHAASAGTVYLLADYLQLNPRSSRRSSATSQKIAEQVAAGISLPPSVSVYVPPKEGDEEIAQAQKNVNINRGRLGSTKASANSYLVANFEPFIDHWGYYYLYALERYAYFRERAEGKVIGIPDWYDTPVEILFQRQKDDGSFQPPQRGENTFYSTCFAVLFLVRSSEVLVSAGGEGNLAGGKGFRVNVRLDIAEGGGRIKTFDVVRGLDDVMQLLGSEDIDEQQFDLIQDSLTKAISQLSQDKSRGRAAQMAFLRGLVTDRNFFRRLIAVKVLSRQQDLDNVPALIYALGDPDPRVCVEAHNGLRLISRKLDAISISDDPDYSEFQSVKREWTDWYLKIRPGAQLLD